VTLLGERAYLRPAHARRGHPALPVFFMCGLYRGRNEYHVVFEQVADFSNAPAGTRNAAVHRRSSVTPPCSTATAAATLILVQFP